MYRFSQPKLEFSQKNSKKIQKIERHHSCFISIHTRPGLAEKAIKLFSHRVRFLPYRS